MVTDKKVEQLLNRITALENRVDELEQHKEELEQENQQLDKENKRLRAKTRWYEEPHTPPSKEQADEEESSPSGGDEDDKQPCTNGGTLGRKSGHTPEWRDAPDPNREIEVTCDCCPECGGTFDESAGVPPAGTQSLRRVQANRSKQRDDLPSSGRTRCCVIGVNTYDRCNRKSILARIPDIASDESKRWSGRY